MYAGIDVAHSRTDSKNRKATAYSIASVVANVDTEFGQWPGLVRYQRGNEETVKDLEIMMENRLSLFGTYSGTPANIVVYRGGVSDGNYQTVLAEEFPMIANACDKICKTRPKITIIMVGKGHQKRFYPMDRATAAPKCQHISKPGTLVDSCKESNRGWEFFLQTHFVTKSSKKDASPAAVSAKPVGCLSDGISNFGADSHIGKTSSLRGHQGRSRIRGKDGRGDDKLSLLPFRKIHCAHVGLPADLLCGSPLPAWPLPS